MYDILLFTLFIAQMLIGVPLYAALLMTSFLGLVGMGNLTLAVLRRSANVCFATDNFTRWLYQVRC